MELRLSCTNPSALQLHLFCTYPSIWCQKSWSILVQVMACRLFRVEPLPKPMATHCLMDPQEQHWNWNQYIVIWIEKIIWKCYFQKAIIFRPQCAKGTLVSCIHRRCHMAFIEPMHRSKPNITYLLTCIHRTHYSDVTWIWWCLKSLAIPLFFNSLFRLTTKKTSKLHSTGLHRGLVIRKALHSTSNTICMNVWFTLLSNGNIFFPNIQSHILQGFFFFFFFFSIFFRVAWLALGHDCLSREDQAPVYFIFGPKSSDELQWLDLVIGHQDTSLVSKIRATCHARDLWKLAQSS